MPKTLQALENDTVICARRGCYKRSLRRANLCMVCEAEAWPTPKELRSIKA